MPSESPVGRVVAGRYRIVRPLGAGAHGVVDLADDQLNSGGLVALKRLEGIVGASDPDPAARVLRWFRHPRWAEVLDEGRLDAHGRFQVLRYIPGTGLDRAREALPPQEVFRFLEDAARVLGALHAAGLVHYDVTPGNFVREERPDGVVFTLTDGGLAHVGPVRGIARGTPLFMAPEVLEGVPHDARADLYSLGLVAYRLATGTDPFTGTAGEVLGRRRREDPPAASTRNAAVPPSLDRVLASLLRRVPNERPADAAALLELLATEGRPTARHPLPDEGEALVASGPFVGRSEALDRFRRACLALQEDVPVRSPGDEALGAGAETAPSDLLLVLRGPSGSGCTRLAREMADIARREGLHVLALSGREGAADRRGTVRRLSEALSNLSPEDDPYRSTAALGRGSAPAGDDEPDPRAIERLVALAERVAARGPVVIFVEDFAELAQPAQEAIRVLGRELFARSEHPDGRRPPRVLLVVDHGPEAPDALLIPDAVNPRRPLLEVSPFRPEETQAFLETRLPGIHLTDADLKALNDAADAMPGALAALAAEGLRRGDLRRDLGRWVWPTDAVASYQIRASLAPEVVRAWAECGPAERDGLAALAWVDCPLTAEVLAGYAGPTASGNLARSPLVRLSPEGETLRIALASRALRERVRAEIPLDDERADRLVGALAAATLPEALPDRARLLAGRGRLDEALACLRDAASCRPAVRRRALAVLADILARQPDLLSSAPHRLLAAHLLLPFPDATPVADALFAALPSVLGPDDLEPAHLLASHDYAARRYERVMQLTDRRTLAPANYLRRRMQATALRAEVAQSKADTSTTSVAHRVRVILRHVVRRGRADEALAADVLLATARVRLAHRQFRRAATLATRALRHSRRARDMSLCAQSYNNLAVALQFLDDLRGAERALARAARIRSMLGETTALVGTIHNLARIRLRLGFPLEAAVLHSRAVALGSRHAHYHAATLSLLSLAEIYEQGGNSLLASSTLLRARETSRAAHAPALRADASCSAAQLAALLGRQEQTAELLRDSASLARSTHSRQLRRHHLVTRATLSFLLGHHAQAGMLARRPPDESTAASSLSLAYRALVRISGAGLLRSASPRSPALAPFRRGLARVLAGCRVAQASAKTPHDPTTYWRQAIEDPCIAVRQRRLLLEVLLCAAQSERIHPNFRELTLSLLPSGGHDPSYRPLEARVSAVRCAEDLKRRDLPSASIHLTRGLSILVDRASPVPSRHRLGAVDQLPPEFAKVVTALKSSAQGRIPSSGSETANLWTELHSQAHVLALRSGAVHLPDSRVQHALRAMLSAASNFKTGIGAETLLSGLARVARELTRAEQACIVLFSPGAKEEVYIDSALGSGPPPCAPYRVSQTVVNRVLSSKRALLLHDVYGDTELMERPSIAAMSLRSVICVPLTRGNQVFGVMYADSRAGAGSFDKTDLEILSLFGEQAAAVIGTSRLVADLKHSYEELKSTQERLIRSERLRAIGELTSGVAHEFNNLLTAMLARVQLLQLDFLPVSTKESLQTIEKAILDAAGMVRRLQAFSRSKTEVLQRVDLQDVCTDVVELLRPLWSTRRRIGRPKLVVRLRAEGPCVVHGDPTELREVVTNLLKNSVEALDAGGSVQLTVGTRGDTAHVEVSDDGPGIPYELQRKIFTPFFTTKGERGTGLGLCLSQQIIERHGGELRLQSTPGQGTVASFELPLSSAKPNAPPSPVAPGNAIPETVVLVVDDDAEVLRPLCNYLARSGLRVSAASSATEALSHIETVSPDLLITDLAMPGMDGLELCRRARRQYPNLPVILMTGRASGIDPAQTHRIGAAAVLAKPFTMRQVLDLVAEIRGRSANPL